MWLEQFLSENAVAKKWASLFHPKTQKGTVCTVPNVTNNPLCACEEQKQIAHKPKEQSTQHVIISGNDVPFYAYQLLILPFPLGGIPP